MNKKYLMNGLAALALVASVSSCVSDADVMSQADLDAAAKENAELQLGFAIPEGQTWDMASQVTTDIVVNLGVDQSYTVGIYDGEPLHNRKAKFYALEKVSEGGTLNTSITLPKAMNYAFVVVFDKNLNAQAVQAVPVINGKITANIGGTTGNRAMRAAFTDKWTNEHSCNWESKLSFELPAGAIDVTQPNFDKSGSVYYIPEGTTGEVSLGWLGLNGGAELYNYGNVTGINDVNYNGTITLYNAGTLTNFGPSSGGRHTVINTGSLTVCGYANIGDLYNGGELILERGHNPYWPNEGGSADIPNAMNIYSSEDVYMPDGGDLKAVCDIHGKLIVGDEKNVKIQNSTTKYICAIIATGKVENVDGPLQTSYVKADLFTFDGNPIYLLPNGHVDVTTLQVPNSNCHVFGHTNSVALVEATNFEFGNKNDFTHTFSDNIYFKVNGGYIKVDNCYNMGQSHYFKNVADYLADTTHADEFALAANRVDNANCYATGTPECGDTWTVGTPTEPEPETPEIPETPKDLPGKPAIYTYAFEDNIAFGDYDMNDVVLKVSYPKNDDGTLNTNRLDCKLVAAGATYAIEISIGDKPLFDGREVHDVFEVGKSTMVNTGSVTNVTTKKPQTCQIDTPTGWDGDWNNLDVKIHVINTDETIKFKEENGKKAPYAIMIPADWAWPKEHTNIKNAYLGFEEWAKSLNRNIETEGWFNDPVKANVVSDVQDE